MHRLKLLAFALGILTFGALGFTASSASAQIYGGTSYAGAAVTYVLAVGVPPGGTFSLPDGTVISCPTGCPAGETFSVGGANYGMGYGLYGSTYSSYATIVSIPTYNIPTYNYVNTAPIYAPFATGNCTFGCGVPTFGSGCFVRCGGFGFGSGGCAFRCGGHRDGDHDGDDHPHILPVGNGGNSGGGPSGHHHP